MGKAVLSSLLCAALVFTAWAQDPSAASPQESRLVALENAWNLAQLHHDARALNTLVGNHFVYTDTDGTVMNKARFLADIQDPDFHATSIANDNLKVSLYPNAAVVTGTYHTKGSYKGKPIDHVGRFTDTWIEAGGQWQCVASHTTLMHK